MADSASPADHSDGKGPPDSRAITLQLQAILNSPGFAEAERLRRFLEFIVTEVIGGRSDQLKESVIGAEVFGRPDFDPKAHAVVRTTANRLRTKLQQYYEGPGKDETLRIELPKGCYVPKFRIAAKPADEEPRRSPKPRQFETWRFSITLCAILLLLAGAVLMWRVRSSAPFDAPPQTQWGRILAKSTSEGARPKVIPLRHEANWLAPSPDEKRVYAASSWSRFLTVISTKDDSLKTWTLPQDGGPLVVSPNGSTLYIGSRMGGIMVADSPQADLRTPKLVTTAGPVWDLALTPDGSKLFVAMGHQGVWRFLTRDWTARELTNQGCPIYLKIGPDGRTLVVTYQCGGPAGRSGHDSVEFFDTQTEEPLGTLTGMPFVGGAVSFSPDGKSVVLNGLDACSDNHYDNQYCPSFPSIVFHFVRISDRLIQKTIGVPVGAGGANFIDLKRVLLFGSNLAVMSASEYTIVEKWPPQDPRQGESPHDFGAMALLPKRRRIYLCDGARREIMILDAEDDTCKPPSNGLVAFYSGDGVVGDVIGGSSMLASPGVQFGPGRVGQAFVLDGVSGHLVSQPLGDFQFGYRDSSISTYVNFGGLEGSMTILDRRSLDGQCSVHFEKAPDNRLVFEFTTTKGTQFRLYSRTRVVPDRWYHLAVTKDDRELAMYVNGVREDRCGAGTVRDYGPFPIYLGSSADGSASLKGKLDEIMFYDRALTGEQVRDLYLKRESGACRM
jgi:hypothetical protein